MLNNATFLQHIQTAVKAQGRNGPDSIADLEKLLARPGQPTTGQVEAEFKKIPSAKAEKYSAALQYVANETNVPYIALVLNSFSNQFTGDFGVDTASSTTGVKYTTPHFHSSAKLFSILPAGRNYRLGYIQICTARTQEHRYYGTNVVNGWRITGTYPIADSSSAANIPFYHVGVGYGCTANTAENVIGGTPATREFQLDDNFNNCGLGRAAQAANGSMIGGTSLKQIKRDQSFTAWIAAKDMTTSTIRVFKEVSYRFDFDIDFNQAQPNTYVIVNRTKAPVVTTPMPGFVLPGAALTTPTMNDVDQFAVF